jgi:hypothetical protein
MKRDFDLFLDTFSGVQQYCLSRSEQTNDYNGNPIVDGVYVWRPELGDTPPNKMRLTLEWDNEFESAAESSQ